MNKTLKYGCKLSNFYTIQKQWISMGGDNLPRHSYESIILFHELFGINKFVFKPIYNIPKSYLFFLNNMMAYYAPTNASTLQETVFINTFQNSMMGMLFQVSMSMNPKPQFILDTLQKANDWVDLPRLAHIHGRSV